MRWVGVRKTWVGGDCLQSLGSELNESESLVFPSSNPPPTSSSSSIGWYLHNIHFTVSFPFNLL